MLAQASGVQHRLTCDSDRLRQADEFEWSERMLCCRNLSHLFFLGKSRSLRDSQKLFAAIRGNCGQDGRIRLRPLFLWS